MNESFSSEDSPIYPVTKTQSLPLMPFPDKSCDIFLSSFKIMFTLQGSCSLGLATLDLNKFFTPILYFAFGSFFCVILAFLLGFGQIPLSIKHCHSISFCFKSLMILIFSSLLKIIFFIFILLTIFTFVYGVLQVEYILLYKMV